MFWGIGLSLVKFLQIGTKQNQGASGTNVSFFTVFYTACNLELQSQIHVSRSFCNKGKIRNCSKSAILFQFMKMERFTTFMGLTNCSTFYARRYALDVCREVDQRSTNSPFVTWKARTRHNFTCSCPEERKYGGAFYIFLIHYYVLQIRQFTT